MNKIHLAFLVCFAGAILGGCSNKNEKELYLDKHPEEADHFRHFDLTSVETELRHIRATSGQTGVLWNHILSIEPHLDTKTKEGLIQDADFKFPEKSRIEAMRANERKEYDKLFEDLEDHRSKGAELYFYNRDYEDKEEGGYMWILNGEVVYKHVTWTSEIIKSNQSHEQCR